jgi:hypothetical protein
MSETRSLSLRDYVQHTQGCGDNWCRDCARRRGEGYIHTDTDIWGFHPFKPCSCTCGLDDALRAQEPPQAQLEELTRDEWTEILDSIDNRDHALAVKLARILDRKPAGDTPVSAERST